MSAFESQILADRPSAAVKIR